MFYKWNSVAAVYHCIAHCIVNVLATVFLLTNVSCNPVKRKATSSVLYKTFTYIPVIIIIINIIIEAFMTVIVQLLHLQEAFKIIYVACRKI